MTSIVLAGGKSSRLGHSKALQVVGGRTLIQWVIDRLATLSSEIIVATAYGKPIPFSGQGRARTVADIHPGKGPLAGIQSGLIASSSLWAIVVGCDTPFLSTHFLEYMIEVRSTFDIIVPRVADKAEPLCAVYSKNCLDPIRALLEQNELSILKLFDMVKVRYVEEDEINTYDPQHLSFFNINNQEDLERARKLADENG